MHLVVCDVTLLAEVNGVNNFVVSIGFVSVQIFCLATMTCILLAILFVS